MDARGNSSDPMAFGPRDFLHLGRIHSHSSSRGHHCRLDSGYSRSKARTVVYTASSEARTSGAGLMPTISVDPA